ncbi:MAG: hypothetical protein U0271_07450 [Polyangiaceae bacterium]
MAAPIAVRVALALSVLITGGVGVLDAFAGPGYEIALVTGIVLPSVVAVATSFDLRGDRLTSRTPFDALSRGAALGASVAALSLAVTLLHGVRVGICDLWTGLEIIVLGPSMGLVLAGMWGAIVAELAAEIGRRRTPKTTRAKRVLAGAGRVVLAMSLPVGSIVVSLTRFYSSPMIFAYDPFVGYFSGSLYDTVLDFGNLRTYRLATLATMLALVIAALHLARRADGALRLRWLGRPLLAALGVAALFASVTSTIEGATLDHWHTRSTIAAELGASMQGDRCDIVYASTLDRGDVTRLMKECEAHVIVNEKWWGARGPDKITVFLFADEDQKARLMGASGTNIAKPWRREVYIQGTGYPHRVLGHELMHVIAGSAGRGPFRVAGSLGGLLPNPGLIEGVAVAGSPKDDDLSPMEWARAMRDLKILPRLSDLFALGFLTHDSSMAYTVSGAFIGWLHDRFGADVVRGWYGGGDLKTLTGKSLRELEVDWHADLAKLELPEAAAVQARARFDRPGFFSRRCPRLVDECRDRAAGLAGAGDRDAALVEIARARSYEPENPNLRLDEALFLAGRDDAPVGLEALRAIADDEEEPRYARDRALEELSDRILRSDTPEAAAPGYEDLITRTIEEGKLRTLHVKLRAARDPSVRPAIVALLIGSRGKKADRAVAAEMLGVLDRERTDDGLAPYLLARGYFDAGDYAGAIEHLDRSLARKIDVPRVRAEALRLEIVAACALGDAATAERRLTEYTALEEVVPERRTAARRLVERCTL